MKKVLLIFVMCLFGTSTIFSQTRYIDKVFTDVDVTTNVKYGENYSVLTGTPVLSDLFMDVYEPNGDTETNRPVIIMAHAGSFLPKNLNTLPFGNKQDSAMVEICKEFAKRGYVAVSMDYRLGWNPQTTNQDTLAGTIMNAVYKSLQDMKTCVRYMKKEATAYGVDTTKMVVGGSNSGGYTAVTYASLNDSSEIELLKFISGINLQPYVNMNLWGGFDGSGGTPGFSNFSNPGFGSDVQLALNLGGAVADSSWIEAGEIPIISFHGVADALTPYKTDFVVVAATSSAVVEVSGSYVISKESEAMGNQDLHDQFFNDPYTVEANSKNDGHDGLFPFFGAANGFEPWAWYDENDPFIDNTAPGATGFGSKANPYATKAKALAYIDTIMGYFCPRAVQVLRLPGNTVGIKNVNEFENTIAIYPNPASEELTIRSEFDVNSAALYDVNGKVVWSNINERKNKFTVNVTSFEKGFYILRIDSEIGIINKKVVVN